MIKKIRFTYIILVFLYLFSNPSYASTEAKIKDGANKIKEGATKILKDTFKVEIATKGKKLKEFFKNNTLKLSFEDSIKEYRFKDKTYEMFINGEINESGKWKVHGLLKNQVKLKTDNGSSYYFKRCLKG